MTTDTTQTTRRSFCQTGALLLAGAAAGLPTASTSHAAQPDASRAARLGLLTDIHHADKPPAGSRHYRDSLAKLDEAAAFFNASSCDAVIELGDLIDSADDLPTEIAHLKRAERAYAQVTCPRHYVLGNHCVHNLRKEEFFEHTAARTAHYSFDFAGFHCIVLDACYNADMQPYQRDNFDWTDSNIPPAQLEWLRADLAAADRKKTLVFIHQRLDVTGPHGVRNAPAVRDVLEKSGSVLTVFQGHNHVNDLRDIAGIHYLTLAAMIEGQGPDNSAYALLDLFDDGSLRLTGKRTQQSYNLPRA